MKRLTEVDGKGNWRIAGVEWAKVKGNLYGALCKLKDYEDTGLSPVEVAELNTFDGSQAVKATAKLQAEQRKHKWIPVSERLPEREKEVEVTVERRYDNKTHSFTCRAIYEDGNMHVDESSFDWYDFDIENERVPEGWFEAVSYAEELKAIDDFVIAWRALSEPYKS